MKNKPYNIIFYYPQHFNRSKGGGNPFFDPLIAICKSNKLSHLILEEPDHETRFPRNKKAIRFDIYFYAIIFLRKITPRLFFKNLQKREHWIGSVIKKITFAKFNANVVFTLSNSMGGVWRGYNCKAKIIDYQHGIINKNQNGFFDNGKVSPQISENKKEVAVWGKGFYDVFRQDKQYYENKVHVLGYSQLVVNKSKTTKYKNKIIFSLQFVPEIGIKIKQEMLIKLKRILEELNTLSDEKKPKVLLLNHPRHNNTVDLTSILNEFEFVSIIKQNEVLFDLNYLLHVTFYSTTTFEMAMKEIPTYFLITKNISHANIFLREYSYPIQQNTSLNELLTLYQNDDKKRNMHGYLAKQWGDYYFEPLEEDIFLDIINN